MRSVSFLTPVKHPKSSTLEQVKVEEVRRYHSTGHNVRRRYAGSRESGFPYVRFPGVFFSFLFFCSYQASRCYSCVNAHTFGFGFGFCRMPLGVIHYAALSGR